ncbi:MAG: ribulokinase [Bacteroidetes bacterium]|nr:MAG: ribulokinase [Bacteroidota bacterium]
MNMKYVIGVDFGSDSVRSLVVNASTGEEVATSVHYYKRWKEGLFCDPAANQFRQHPLDYIEGLENTFRECLKQAGPEVSKNIVGISVDTTGSTPVAVDKNGTPLALLPDFSENPNAMFVLWKDHTAIKEAEEINNLCANWDIDYSMYEGGIYSSEWFWAKILKVSRDDAAVRKAAYTWVEHCDWIPFLITGETDISKLKVSRCAAGHKALWHESFGGLPPNEFFIALDPILDGVVDRMQKGTYTSDVPAGNLSAEWAERLGLSTDVVVGVGAFDAHMGAVGGQIEPYYLSKVMGTSTCDILVAPQEGEEHLVRGICGQVDGSVIPGMLGLEAGQSAFGDIYAWFSRVLEAPIVQAIEESELLDDEMKSLLKEEATSKLIQRLTTAAEKEPIGSGKVLSLDWMNGRRTPDANQQLKGVISGLNLGSDAGKIFRSLVEATCYGAKKIVDRFIEEGIPIKGLIGLGGVAKKSPFIMQMMADVMNIPIKIATSEQTCALGSAMFAATAAGLYPDVSHAMEKMGSGFDKVYYPIEKHVEKYAFHYNEYCRLAEVMEDYIMENNTVAV